jgi:hypothetical protein
MTLVHSNRWYIYVGLSVSTHLFLWCMTSDV